MVEEFWTHTDHGGERFEQTKNTGGNPTYKKLEFEGNVALLYGEAMSLLLQKHADYGPLNIANAPGGALNGLRVRMWDKMARINNLLDSNRNPANESLKDSFMDLANYALIAVLVLNNEWPSE